MKVAWCFYGQPRHLLQGSQTVKKFIQKNNASVDFFCHAWYKDDGVLPKSPFAIDREGNNTIFTKDMTKQILSSYGPVSYLFEESQTFSKADLIDSLIMQQTVRGDEYISNVLSMYNSRQKVMRMLIDYETKHGIKYDMIAVSRYDLMLEIPIKINTMDTSKIYSLDNGPPCGRFYVCTAFTIGSPQITKSLYRNIYDNIDKFKNDYNIAKQAEEWTKSPFIINDEEMFMANFALNRYSLSDIVFTPEIPNFC